MGYPPSLSSTGREKNLGGNRDIGTQPVIFDIAYTPYKLKKNATDREIAKHKKERAFYDMSGADNIYKYITTEGKMERNQRSIRCLNICKRVQVYLIRTEC